MQSWNHFVPCKVKSAIGDALGRFQPNSLGGTKKHLTKIRNWSPGYSIDTSCKKMSSSGELSPTFPAAACAR